MAKIYILFSKAKNQFYIGSSRSDSLSRLKAHNAGRVRSTRFGRPWIEVASESFNNYTEARKREIFLKSGVGRKWLKEKFGYFKNNNGGVA